MFYNCANLNYINCLATDISASNCTYNWVSGVASTGTFIKYPDMNSWTTGVNGIPTGWDINEMRYVAFTAQQDNSSIGLVQLSTNQILEYSTDTTTWSLFDKDTNIALNNGDKVYVRGILSADNTESNYTQFNMTGRISASGNCNTLWNYQDLNTPLKAWCGCAMFSGCTSLTTAPELPAAELAMGCYGYMFGYCSSLTTAPELPATTLDINCYSFMFYDCKNLNYIKCLATDISANECTIHWVDGVASEGTFVKHPDMNNWSAGVNSIPTSWTVKDMDLPYVTFTAQQNNSSIRLAKLSTNQTM